MIGAAELLELRRAKRKPEAVWIQLLEAGFVHDNWNKPEVAYAGGRAQIDIFADEVLDHLDFRCVIGMVVHIIAADADHDRMIDLIDRLTEFTPARVLACRNNPPAIVEWTPQAGLTETEIK